MKRSGRSEAWLGDLLTICSELHPGASEVELIAQMLRLDTTAASRTTAAGESEPPPPPSQLLPPEPPPAIPGDTPLGQPRHDAAGGSAPLSRKARLAPAAADTGPLEPPSWSNKTPPMLPPLTSPTKASEPAPILAARVRRAILAAAASTLAQEGVPDLRAILRTIGHGRPITHLPRRQRPTLRRGAQLLIDKWLGMAPFAADASGIALYLGSLISSDRLRVLSFVGSPLGPMRWPDKKQRPWSPPPRGTPVFILSDFGLGGPPLDASHTDLWTWVRFAKKVRAAGCPVVGLIPCEPARWPRELASCVTLLHWSERLTAGAVRRALAHGIGRFA
jgi:hypothetical protein